MPNKCIIKSLLKILWNSLFQEKKNKRRSCFSGIYWKPTTGYGNFQIIVQSDKTFARHNSFISWMKLATLTLIWVVFLSRHQLLPFWVLITLTLIQNFTVSKDIRFETMKLRVSNFMNLRFINRWVKDKSLRKGSINSDFMKGRDMKIKGAKILAKTGNLISRYKKKFRRFCGDIRAIVPK